MLTREIKVMQSPHKAHIVPIIIIIIIIIIQRTWKVKTRVIPVIIGATGTISKSFAENT